MFRSDNKNCGKKSTVQSITNENLQKKQLASKIREKKHTNWSRVIISFSPVLMTSTAIPQTELEEVDTFLDLLKNATQPHLFFSLFKKLKTSSAEVSCVQSSDPPQQFLSRGVVISNSLLLWLLSSYFLMIVLLPSTVDFWPQFLLSLRNIKRSF